MSAQYDFWKLHGGKVEGFGSLYYVGGQLHSNGGVTDPSGLLLGHASEVVIMYMLFRPEANVTVGDLLLHAIDHGLRADLEHRVVAVIIKALGGLVASVSEYLIEVRGTGEVLVDALESATHLMQIWIEQIHYKLVQDSQL